MRVRAALGATVASITVLVLGWQAGQHPSGPAALTALPAGTSSSAGAPGGAAPAAGTPAPAAGTPSAATTAPSAAAANGTFTGTVTQTQYGPVQVAITVTGGKLSGVTALQLTNADRRSVSISNRAEPILRQEVLAAGSAKVSMVSGATYTSQAYLSSLQSALDQAGI